MTLRTGHGAGAGQPRIEVLPPDELPPATPPFAVQQQRLANGRFAAQNTAGTAKRVRPGLRGSLPLDQTDPRYRAFARWGTRYGAHRRRELAQSHGGYISAGAGTIIESAAQAMAASRYIHSLAAASGDPELFRAASVLASTARQHELAAWELAAREANSQPKEDPYERIRREGREATEAAQKARDAAARASGEAS